MGRQMEILDEGVILGTVAVGHRPNLRAFVQIERGDPSVGKA